MCSASTDWGDIRSPHKHIKLHFKIKLLFALLSSSLGVLFQAFHHSCKGKTLLTPKENFFIANLCLFYWGAKKYFFSINSFCSLFTHGFTLLPVTCLQTPVIFFIFCLTKQFELFYCSVNLLIIICLTLGWRRITETCTRLSRWSSTSDWYNCIPISHTTEIVFYYAFSSSIAMSYWFCLIW